MYGAAGMAPADRRFVALVRAGRAVMIVLCALPAVVPVTAEAQIESRRIVFMEPVADPAEEGALELFDQVTDPDRVRTYGSWLDNMPAAWALSLYDAAREVALSRDPATAVRQPPAFYIALVPGGNHADLGFRLRTQSGIEAHPRTAFIRLGADEWRFDTTLLHETGHAVMHVLSGGRAVEARTVSSISHSTAALTDRETAFREGYAIHLETLAARLDTSRASRNRYRHEQMPFGRIKSAPRLAEYYHQLVDLLSFAQTVSRYREIVENSFAFRSAWAGPDYLRVQLEKGRDFAELRDANQLLQSEGFYASFFYAVLFRGVRSPDRDAVIERQRRLLEVLADVLDRPEAAFNRPYLLEVVRAWSERYPDDYSEVLDVFLDLSHGVFVDDEARSLWREAYLAALRLDIVALDVESIERRRQRWRVEVLSDPAILERRLGPELRCLVRGPQVRLVALGEPVALRFDINTVQPGIIRLIPGISDMEVERWSVEREREPFVSFEDFERRVGLRANVRSVLVFDPA